MKASDHAIQIIPELTIDDKYAAIIDEAQRRIKSFTDKALSNGRLGELFVLEKSGIDAERGARVLTADGRLLVGFQFELKGEGPDSNFGVFVRKLVDDKRFKFYLTPTVQEIMLQLISLEDRRTIGIFSMLNSSLDVAYRILTTLYGTQLKGVVDRAAPVVRELMLSKLEKLSLAKSPEDPEIWRDGDASSSTKTGGAREDRPGTQNNILQVMPDETLSDEINQYVEQLVSRKERIREKRRQLEENPDMPRSEIFNLMVREDMDQLENCYARIHIYLRAFYKNKNKRNPAQNKILRQFFAGEIEGITGETGLLEDLLSLNEAEYFMNLYRHKDL